ncbi:hypothetical protein [Stakelama tenebrarum]|uniref:Uncharacterized protein n=1 Tax=Stakelama tenebrarum TaxID=2711215 RepID=A0A6G6Y8Y8_9SPHN|nr:hypothetical protein [Sphingosinithalassobacter tenebrarum]QIG81311.1 hypothetical protein G5C33_16995 [Sphingosinithalassobacter tenebrarum]
MKLRKALLGLVLVPLIAACADQGRDAELEPAENMFAAIPTSEGVPPPASSGEEPPAPSEFELVAVGPGIGCGDAFAIELADGERLLRRDSGLDFLVYRLEQAGKTTVIYEGNAPMSGAIVKHAQRGWPAVVAVHGEQSVADRVMTEGPLLSRCPYEE